MFSSYLSHNQRVNLLREPQRDAARCICTLVSCISPLPKWVKQPFSRTCGFPQVDGSQNGWFITEKYGTFIAILTWKVMIDMEHPIKPYPSIAFHNPFTLSPNLRFSGQSTAQLSLVSRARQFSSFIDPRLLGNTQEGIIYPQLQHQHALDQL